MTREQKLIWAAGFIDGEGTITIKRYNRKWKDKPFISYQSYISCSQVSKYDKATLILQELFGGSISRYAPKSLEWADVCQWIVASDKALKCAEELLPYLVLKNKHADILLDFQKNIIGNSKGYRLSQDEKDQRENYFYEMRKLNVKGKLRLQRLSEEGNESCMQQSEHQL